MAERDCLFHDDVKRELRGLIQVQRDRSCSDHEARLCEVERQTTSQWAEIKGLQKTVWTGVGILTAAGFLGSVVGSLLVTLVKSFGR